MCVSEAGAASHSFLASDFDPFRRPDMRFHSFRLLQSALVITAGAAVALCETQLQAGDFCFTMTPYEVQQSPSHVVCAAFNGDGWNDLVAANHDIGEDSISLLFNKGNGVLAPAINYPVERRPYWLGAVDLDGDADTDLIVSNFFGFTVA